MAKELNMQFSGRIGPLIGCLRDGKYYYRSRPAKVRQTKATKASSGIFALASKAGKVMRQHLQQSIPNTKDIQMQRRLVGSISNWLRLQKGDVLQPTNAIPFINHFNFNLAKPLEEVLKLPLDFIQTGPGQTVLQIPAFIPVKTIKAPANTTQIELCISAVAFRLDSETSFGNESVTIKFSYDNTQQPARQIPFALQTEQGNILIAALQLRYITQATPVKYLPAVKSAAAIVGAIYV